MKYLNRKLFRTIINKWTQFFSVFLMAFLSVLIYVGLQGAWHGLEESLDSYITKSNIPNQWIQTVAVSDSDIEKIEKIDCVSNVVAKKNVKYTVVDKDKNEDYIYIESCDSSLMNYNIIEGSAISDNENGIWLDEEYAQANDINVNDEITVVVSGTETSVNVIGLFTAADKIYFTGTLEFLGPNHAEYGYALASKAFMENTLNSLGPDNYLEIYSDDVDLRKKIEDIFEERLITYYDRKTLSEVSEPNERVGQIRNLSYMFSGMFILLAILAMYTTIRRLIESENQEIAILKAIGISNKGIIMHYSSYGIVVGLGGAIFGTLISPILSNFVLATQKNMFSIEKWEVKYSYNSLIVIGLIIVICVGSALIASVRAVNGLPIKYLRGNVEKKGRHYFIERLIPSWNTIKSEYKWAFRDAAANKIKVLMGIIGVTGGMMLLIVGFGTPDSINYLIENAYTRDFTYSKRIEVDNYDEIKDDVSGQWVQIMQAHYSPDDGFDRLLIVISDGDYVNMYDQNGEPIKKGGIYVTEGFAERANLKVGDKVKVKTSLDAKKYSYTIKGIITSETNQGAYILADEWEKSGGIFRPTTLLVGKDDNNNIDEISEITVESQKNNAYDFVKGLMSVFFMIIGFAILLVVVVLYNLGALNFVERTRDYATLRVLGFHKKQIRNITMIENVATTFIGWIIGIPLGKAFLDAYVSTFSTIRLEYTSVMSPRTLLLASLIVWAASLSTTLFIGRRIQGVDMVEALKGVE